MANCSLVHLSNVLAIMYRILLSGVTLCNCRDAARNQASESTSATPGVVGVIPHHDHVEATRRRAKAPDDSKINQKKPRISLNCLYAN